MARLTGRLACIGALAAYVAWTPAPALAQGEPIDREANAVIVLDGSNSMNARLPGDTVFKHVMVREAIRKALPRVTPGTQLALAAFGHRRPSDCTDFEVVQPLTPDTSRISAAIERFQPKGFSPVVQTLRAAARALPQGPSGKASLIVILDDLASCRGEDPCKVAADLKRDNPALNIHVVGLALKPADAQVMACVAKQTDGRLFDAQDGPAAVAAIEQALQLASATLPAARPAGRPAAQAPAKGAPQPAPNAKAAAAPAQKQAPLRPGLHLSAHLADGRPALEQAVQWRVLKDGAPAGSPPVVEAVQPRLSVELPNGSYVAEVQAGLVTARRPFEITSPAATPLEVPLNAAMLSLSAALSKGGAPLRRAMMIVSPAAAGGRPLWLARTGADDLVVPAGSYRVSAEDGMARVEETVTVAAGVRKEVELTLSSGRLVIAASLGNGDPITEQMQFVVEADDPDSPTGKREVMRTAAAKLDVALPPGSYQVTARRGAAEARERLAVRAGEETSRTIQIALARVRLSSRLGIQSLTNVAPVYRIERLDSTQRVVTRSGEGEPMIELNPGRYRIEARVGAQNAIAVREVEFRAGTESQLDLATGAGSIRLKLPGGLGSLGFGEVFWQVRNETGQTVWRTSQMEPLLVLAPGRYTALVEMRDKLLERTFDVRAGDSRTIEVGG